MKSNGKWRQKTLGNLQAKIQSKILLIMSQNII